MTSDQVQNSIPPTSSSSNDETIPISTLFKFIHPFDGNREELTAFLTDCNHAFKLATQTQKHLLLTFIQTQIRGKAKTACTNRTFQQWDDLKEFLKSMYQDRKHYAQIINELTGLQQSYKETIQSYSIRIESTLKRAINAVQQNCNTPNDLNGQIAMLNQIALNRIVYYSKPEISCQLRTRDLKTLNEAISYALNEEQIQNMYAHNPFKKPVPTSSKFCKNCKRPGHDTNNCFKRSQINNINTKSEKEPQNSAQKAFNPKFCKYCKHKGHTIEQCWKRQSNNSKNVNRVSPVADETSNQEQQFQVTQTI